MFIYLMIPFVLQAIVIMFDEIYFHVKRGLPKWERIGHPIDTFSVLLCMIWVLVVPFSSEALKIYCFLAIFSCVMVTKDEFIHKHYCPASENYLHAFLYILHPITLTCVGFIWPAISNIETPAWLSYFLDNPSFLHIFLYMQTFSMGAFFFYQIIYWNLIWKKRTLLKQ